MIVFDRVSVKFTNKYVIKDFSLEIQSGEKVLLFGKSGIGKSTLFRLLLGFVRPDSGKITFNQKELDKNSVCEIRKNAAYVSQDSDIGYGTVREIIGQSFQFKVNKSLTPSKQEIAGLLELFELKPEILDEDFSDISGGEKQRIAIINALLLKRPLFLLDEATSALDGALKKRVIELFTTEKEKTVLVISHDKEWLEHNVRLVNLKLT